MTMNETLERVLACVRCEGAARASATPGQVAELLGVALLMDGGTASVYDH